MKDKFLLILLIISISTLISCEFIAENEEKNKSMPVYTVTFDSRGGSAVQSQKVKDGGLVTKPVDPVKIDYAFNEWYKEETLINKWNFAGDTVTKDITLYAKWGCRISYDSNGATSGNVPLTEICEIGSEANVKSNTGNLVFVPVPGTAEAFKFICWNTKQDGSGIDHTPGTKIIVTTNIILYAKWGPFQLRDIGPAGGLIFYDKGEFSDGWRYLECAPKETEWQNQWGGYGVVITGATGLEIGMGKNNTNDIVSYLGEGVYAAKLCYDFVYGGYDDWFLPSKDELNFIYKNLKLQNYGNFNDDYYWSSSRYSLSHFKAWSQLFSNGEQYIDTRSNLAFIRAIRCF